jgi:membrane associated rhomboid family serine protease
VLYLLAVAGVVNELDLVVVGKLRGDWWRPFTAPFIHGGGGVTFFTGGAYQFATMLAVGVFGWLLERRHGPWVVGLIYLLAGVGGMFAAAALAGDQVAIGSNGLALGLLCAWAVPDLLAWRAGEDWEGDLLGVAAFAAVLLLMPLAVSEASPVAGVVGAVVGLALGLPLARLSAR